MKVRDVVIADQESITDTKVWTKNITVNLPIQWVYVLYRATNGATSNTVGKLCHEITKLEVVDGSDVLYSVRGREAKALNFYDSKFLPFHHYSQDNADIIQDAFFINFGRFFGDRDYYLDPRKFTNPQMKFSSEFTVSATAGIATGTAKLTVVIRVIDEGAPPQVGFVQTKEIYNWTTLSSGEERISLPRDLPYKAILVGDLETLIEPDIDLTKIKLSIDYDRWVPYELRTAEILNMNLREYGWGEEICELLPNTSFSWLSNLFRPGGSWICEAGGIAKAIATIQTAERTQGAMTTEEAGEVKVLVKGQSPHSTLYLPFGNGIIPEDFFAPQGLAAVELICTMGGAGGDGRVIIQQIRS